MRLGAEEINAWRTVVQWILRGIAVPCLAAGAYCLLKCVLFAAGIGRFNLALQSHSLYVGLALLAVGATLGFPARRISKWIITLPSTGCPRCGHARAPGAQDTRCSECGLECTSGPR
jgi:hypothetical protein